METTTRQRTRVHRVLLALTDDEYRRLSEAASAVGIHTGTYARVVLFRALEAGGEAKTDTKKKGEEIR